MLRLHDYLSSGNGYKIRLLLTQLGIPFERIEWDITQGATRTPEFLRMNPNGRIPLLELESGHFLAESNAILSYLAEGTPFLPAGRLERGLAFLATIGNNAPFVGLFGTVVGVIHAFEELGAVRVQLKTDSNNVHSQRAIEKLGARREGVLRSYQCRANGKMRDTVIYSLTAEEWPDLKNALEARLAALGEAPRAV